MPSYMVYYWLQHGDKGHSISECLAADSVEQALVQVQDRMQRPSFSFHSASQGHVILMTQHVQYVEIEEDGSACEESDLPHGFPRG